MRFADGYMQAEVGDFVYKAFKPQTPGKVVRVIEGEMRTDFRGRPYRESAKAEVCWLNGTTSIVSMLNIRSFRELIADHERKLETHRSKLERLEAL